MNLRSAEENSPLRKPDWLPRPVMVALILLAVSTGLFVLILGSLGGRELPARGVHTFRAIGTAFNWAECGEFAGLREDSGVQSDFGTNTKDLDTPLRTLAERRAGSLDNYCDHEFRTWTNEDSSLFYFFSFLLKLHPGASLNQMYLMATAIVSVIFAVTGYVVWRATKSLFLSGSIVVASAGWYVVGTLTLFMSSRVFAWPLLLIMVIAMAIALSSAISGRVIRAVTILVLAGIIAAFAANMRSTLLPHIPLVLIVFLATSCLTSRTSSSARALGKHVVMVVVFAAAFGVGYVGYQQIAIAPLDDLDNTALSSHPIFHPIVLGLAVPPNALSDDEGIAWLDGVGYEIAERIEPGSTTNLHDYERVMRSYYFELWKDRPMDMIRTYLIKADIAGVSQAGHLRSVGIGWISPLSVMPSGIILGLLLLALNAWSYFARIEDPIQVFLLRALLASALAGYAVTWIVHSTFSLYILESPFSYVLLTILFWWFVGRLALRYLLRTWYSRDGSGNDVLRFVSRLW